MTKKIDMVGRVYGRLTVLEEREPDPKMGARWLCECRCGNRSVVVGKSLRGGLTKSCGCLAEELRSDNHSRYVKHGMHGTRIYGIWVGMVQRTTKPNNQHYPNYGGRGIKICDRWRTFEGFYADMGPTYRDDLTIDRIDNDGPYSPENCRWATYAEQNRNRRDNVRVEWRGRDLLVAEWADLIGLNGRTIGERIRKGWSVDRALTQGVSPERLAGL